MRREISFSPYKVRARLRGMGVALIWRVWGIFQDAFFVPSSRISRCLTQKRCCSSIITIAKFSKHTSSSRSAWVPMITSIFPDARWDLMIFFCFCGMLPTKRWLLIQNSWNIYCKDCSCCLASISVGAIIAHCRGVHRYFP